jgi:hypothetical protein
LDKIDKKNTNQKKNLINKINSKKEHKPYEFQIKNASKSCNRIENNKRKINKNNVKNRKNINIIINQNLNNSTRNLSNNFTENIKENSNKLNELNSSNKKTLINPKNEKFMKYRIINKSPINSYKKGDIILSNPSIYKSIFKNLSIIKQIDNTKNDLIKRFKISEYKPMFNTQPNSDILYNNKYNNKNNNSKKTIKSTSNTFFNPIKDLKDMNNNKKIITTKKKKESRYQFTAYNIFKHKYKYNISNEITELNLGQRLLTNKYNSTLLNNHINEINFGLNYKEKYDMNNLFRSKNVITSQHSPKKLNFEELKALNKNNLEIKPIKKNIYFFKENK